MSNVTRLPWAYNNLELPYHTGNRFVYLPFTMYPGHRGYRPIPALQGVGGGFPMAFAGGNPLMNLIPMLGNFLGGAFSGGMGGAGGGMMGGGMPQLPGMSLPVKTGAAKEEEPSSSLIDHVKVITHPAAWNPIILGTILGSGLGSGYMIHKNKKRLKDKKLLEKVFSNPSLFGMLAGGITGGAFGLVADQGLKFLAER